MATQVESASGQVLAVKFKNEVNGLHIQCRITEATLLSRCNEQVRVSNGDSGPLLKVLQRLQAARCESAMQHVTLSTLVR